MAGKTSRLCFTAIAFLTLSGASLRLVLAAEFVNMNFNWGSSDEPLFGWSVEGEPFVVSFGGFLLARTDEIVVYEGSELVGGGWGLIPSIDGLSVYIDSKFSDIGISQRGTIPADARFDIDDVDGRVA